MSSKSASSRPFPWVIVVLILLLLIIILYFIVVKPPADDPKTAQQWASGWTVKNNADWTPFPPSANPLGAPNDTCTGGTINNSWAHFTFGAMNLPSGASIAGIEVCMKYLSPSGSNTVQLTRSGTLIGSSKTIASVSGPSNCAGSSFTGVGGDSDTWGSGATLADFNGGTIGVRLTQNANTVDLDAVELKVYFEE